MTKTKQIKKFTLNFSEEKENVKWAGKDELKNGPGGKP
jgi:hypothetical protein